MASRCVFCGSDGPISREHVFGQWVARLGLDPTPARHRAGPLNRLSRDLGEQPPFRLRVKDVCATCNNGWMADLEGTAQRVLSPLICGEPATIAVPDQEPVVTWTRKTALVAMLLSSEEQRYNGYGLPKIEYETLYRLQGQPQYLDGCQSWVGASGDPTVSAVQVTPMCVRISGDAEPAAPHGYLATIALGSLVLQTLWFTAQALGIEMSSSRLAQIWPPGNQVVGPFRDPISEASFKGLAEGGQLESMVEHVTLQPWSRATDLPRSEVRGGAVEVPALCGIHAVRYPAALLREALNGRYYAFMTSCDCTSYLVQTAGDSVRFKAAGAAEGIGAMYEDLAGDEHVLEDEHGSFFCKRLRSAAL